ALAPWSMPVAATVVANVQFLAAVAFVYMPAHGWCAASA
ncbi:MAG: hypothetical protein ACI91R_001548, partial [Vicingaceae bacterium]